MVFNFPKWHSLNRNNSRGYFKWHKSKRKLAQFDRNQWHKYSENTGTNRTKIANSFVFRTDNNFYLAVPDVNNPRRLTYVLLGNYKLFPKTEDTAAKIEVFSTADNIPSAVLYIDRLDKSMLYMTTKISDKDYYLRFKKM